MIPCGSSAIICVNRNQFPGPKNETISGVLFSVRLGRNVA